MGHLRPAWVVTLLVACSAPPEETDPTDATTVPEPTLPDPTTDTLASTGSTGTTGDTGEGPPPWELDVDCSKLLPLPAKYEVLTWAPAAEDFTFSPDGYLVVATGAITRTPYGGPTEVMVPNTGDVRGTRMLPDGTLVLARMDTGSIVNVDPVTGAQQVLASGLANPNGIAVGADGRVYVATTERILRVDPATLAVDTIVEMSGRSFDGLTFSPDYSRLYFNEELGRVHWVELAADGTPGTVGGPIQLPVGAFSLLDGMAADACGNLYVTEMGGTVWRVDSTGTSEVAVNLSEPLAVIPALNFPPPGTKGWDANTLYVMDFKGQLYAAEIGVPGKWEPHW